MPEEQCRRNGFSDKRRAFPIRPVPSACESSAGCWVRGFQEGRGPLVAGLAAGRGYTGPAVAQSCTLHLQSYT